MKTVKFLFVGFIVFLLLCVLILRPVNIPENESDLETVKGELVSVMEGSGYDIFFKLKDDDRRYYINRGLEQGLSIQSLQASLGKQVILKYPDHWTLLDPAGKTKHLSMVKISGKTIFSELD
ncbi:MAG: hypothetical protein Roseis2KO_31650 [Roseivirga sp.]